MGVNKNRTMKIISTIKTFLFLLSATICNDLTAQMGDEGTVVSLILSPRVCPAGQPLLLKGNILVNDKAQAYTIKIKVPGAAATSISGQTDSRGDYSNTYAGTNTTGWYAVEVLAADNKGKAVDSFFVSTPAGVATAYQNRINSLIKNSVKNIEQSLNYLQQMPANNQLDDKKEKLRTALQRLGAIKQKANEANQRFTQLLDAIQTLPPAQQAMQPHHLALSEWTSQADEVVPRMEQQQQQYQNISNSCEAINAVIELCGLVSWVMNFQGGLAKVMINIASDKVLPGAVDRVEWTGTDAEKETKKFTINETQKAMTAASLGIDELADFIKGGGLLGDVIQYVSKILYGQKCVDLKGPANAQFTAKMYDKSALYWSYGVQYKGTLTLRYEKTADLTKPVEITGEFEGYKAKYDFFEKIEAVEPFPKGLKVVKRIKKSPSVINASPIANDIGLAGRTLTPGMYRVKVKGKLTDKQLTLEVIKSPLDIAEKVENNTMWLVGIMPALPIPLVKRFVFPIGKARAAFVVGLGENYLLSLSQQDEKLSLRKTFTNNRTMGSANDIKLETKMELNISN